MPNRKAPWIGVGTSGQWTDPEDALVDAHIDSSVISECAYANDGTLVPGIQLNRDETNGAILGVTSNKYGIIQNTDAFGLLEPFCQNGAVIEQAGRTFNGMDFMVARMSSVNIIGDEFTIFICAMNSFNARFPLAVIVTPVRVICQNMFRKLLNGGDAILHIKHGNLAEARLEAANVATTGLLQYQNTLHGKIEELASKQLNPDRLDKALGLMFPAVDPKLPRAITTKEKRDEQRELFLSEYLHTPDNKQYIGTVYGFINGYFNWTTHKDISNRSKAPEERRLTGLLSGADINRQVIDAVLV